MNALVLQGIHPELSHIENIDTDINPIAICKLAAGIINWNFIQWNNFVKYTILAMGVLRVASTLLSQFDVLPESSANARLRGN